MSSKGRAENRAARLLAILQCLETDNCNSAELLQRLGLPSEQLRSLQRDLKLLRTQRDIEQLDDGRYKSLRPSSEALRPLDPVEALALYSAARLLVHHASSFHPSYLNVLRMITHRLPEPVRSIARRANVAYENRPRDAYARNLDIAAQAWREQQVLTFDYQSTSRTEPRRVEFEVYFVEINAHNRAAYIIGHDRLSNYGKPITLKVARMRGVQVLPASYCIPEGFDPLQYLASAWGIMTGEPTRVDLLFSRAVEVRLQEEHFPTQIGERQKLADGRTLISFEVANTRELKPWLLGWGAELEVVNPPALRQDVADTLAQATRLYGST